MTMTVTFSAAVASSSVEQVIWLCGNIDRQMAREMTKCLIEMEVLYTMFQEFARTIYNVVDPLVWCKKDVEMRRGWGNICL